MILNWTDYWLIQNEDSMINFDKNDVNTILVGKMGILYQADIEDSVEIVCL